MRLRRLKVRNFRCYADEIDVPFGSLTALVGRNDSGKSTLFDALDLFLNEGKPDADDGSKHGSPSDIAIGCEFDYLPNEIVIDTTHSTSLQNEYLLNADGHLEVWKYYNGALKTPKLEKTQVIAVHPAAERVYDLLRLTNAELKTRVAELGLSLDGTDSRLNAELRSSIRNNVPDLELILQPIDIDQLTGGKEIWSRLRERLPLMALFKADRTSTDQDEEAQDPMKEAIKLALEEQRQTLEEVTDRVRARVTDVIERTLERLRDLEPDISTDLAPEFAEPRWSSAYKIGLIGGRAYQ